MGFGFPRERRWFVLERPRRDTNGGSETEVTVTSKLPSTDLDCSEESLPPNQAASLIGQPAASHEGKTRAFPFGREPDRGASVMR